MDTQSARRYDVVAFGAHPDDLEVVMGGTAAKLARSGRSILFVDLCEGEPARHAPRGARHEQAVRAAAILGVERTVLTLQDRLIEDTVEARVEVARLLRTFRPRTVFTTLGGGVHPDHRAVTDIVTYGVFYARLPKWEELAAGERLRDLAPHEIDRLFFGHCRMEPPWSSFDFAVDVTATYDQKMSAVRAYEAVFSGDQATLLDKYSAEDRYVGSLVGVPYAEAFKARSPLLVDSPEVFAKSRFG
ncbi:MAG: PIG-L family deacetylase [Acidobacteriota bacterium]|nr:PIG-L family deacetylase [Acidobacteriota bacterium]